MQKNIMRLKKLERESRFFGIYGNKLIDFKFMNFEKIKTK